MFCFLFLAPYARTTRYEEFFFPWKTKEKKARFTRAPHENCLRLEVFNFLFEKNVPGI